jgi:type II secretory pathway component PulK
MSVHTKTWNRRPACRDTDDTLAAYPTRQRPGFFLIIVLIVVAVATMAVYSFTELMVAYDDSAYLSNDIVQARVNVESGVDAIRVLLAQPPEMRPGFGGLYNNPQMFQAVNVSTGADGVTPSNYSVLAPGLDEMGMYGGIRFGLQNESARLNINTLIVLEENSETLAPMIAASEADDEVDSENIAVSLLMGLPGMTEDVADAILDWIDEDEEPRELGAELEYYTTLSTPYSPPNGPLQSVEELLLVRGVTPTLMFGADANRNGVLDPDEQQRFGVTVETPGSLGWASYLTVHGAEANKRRDGSFRVNVNQDDMEILYEQLTESLDNDLYASYIVAYRIAGQPSASTAGLDTGATAELDQAQAQSQGPTEMWMPDQLEKLDLSGGGGTTLTRILDLIDSKVTIGEDENAVTYSSPFPNDPIAMEVYMPILMDALSTQDVDVMPGRINLNECPAELLYGIPSLTAESVQEILELREVEPDDLNRQHETWPLVEGIVTLSEMKTLIPMLTGGGDVYRAQIVGYFESGASHRAEIIIDATTVNPKVVAWRDISHLGRGFDLSVLGLRQGVDGIME